MNTFDRERLHVLHLARVVLEAKTALSIGTGLSESTFDTQLVRDANGLPVLPGTSVTGVLRHLWIEAYGVANAETLFGYQDKKDGQISRLTISWGALLDSRGRPAEGLLIDEGGERLQDPLYEAVLMQADVPVIRDRVRLTHRSAAADKGKFDRAVLPAGHRFALELRLWSDSKEDEDWPRLLELLAHPLFRLGGATRAGLGAMKLVSCHARSFDLKEPDDIAAFRALGRDLADTNGLYAYQSKDPAGDPVRTGTLKLEASGFWRIGEGEEPLIDKDARDKPLKAADLLPKVEEVIRWDTGRGERKLRMCLLPASSLKGALAHRMAFHYRRLTRQWAGSETDETALNTRPPAVAALLGEVKNTKEGSGQRTERGCVGALVIDDAWVKADSAQVARLMHNAIDRFTGGVRDGMLYEEESLFGGKIDVPITLDLKRFEQNCRLLGIGEEERRHIRRAFRLALNDLCRGRLALGSRTTTGNGFFGGELEGALPEWLEENTEKKETAA